MSLKNKIKALFRISKREYEWIRDFHIWRRFIPSSNIKELIGEKLLILAPHSDDEWIGCSQLLVNHKNNITVMNMNMDGGDSDYIHLERYKEMKAVSEIYNYKLETMENEEYLKKYIKSNDISVIMLPCYFDWHEEHIEVMRIFDKVASEIEYNNKVAMYQVSLPIPYQMLTNGCCMNRNEVNNKWKLLKRYYPSQKYLPTRRFLLNERINGAVASCYAIEGYCVLSYDEWSKKYKKYKLNEKKRFFLKSNLQNIGVVRMELQDLISGEEKNQ